MEQYKFKNATVRIHGTEPEGLKVATEKFVKKVMKCKREQKKENQNSKVAS